MRLLLSLLIAISLAGCGSLTNVFLTANYLKDHYCELPEADRGLALIKIRKVFPGWISICVIPDVI